MDSDRSDPVVDTAFLVERYWPGVDERALSSVLPRLEQAAQAMTEEGAAVRHVGSLLMRADQVVFSVFMSASRAHVVTVNERAGLPVDRIAGVLALGFERERDVPADAPNDTPAAHPRPYRKGEE